MPLPFLSTGRAFLLVATAALTVATVPIVLGALVPDIAGATKPFSSARVGAAASTEVVTSIGSANPATGGPSPVSTPAVAVRDAAKCGTGSEGKKVLVSITEQRAWMCDGAVLSYATPVTTGADVADRRTLPGTWQIQGKQTHRWLGGPGYSVQVNYWMPYDGDFGFHDADWQTMPFGSADWRTQGSHGCVHLPHAAMARLYEWAPLGTRVTIEA